MSAELHPPERPILTFKELLIHLGTITLGILIALSLEGLVEWRHHRALVQEARANLALEIRDNKAEMEKLLQSMTKVKGQHSQALQLAGDLLVRGKTKMRELELSYSLAGLSSASWRTAEATGVLSYMSYAEVRKYARVYDLQQQFTRAQDALVEKYSSLVVPPAFDKPVKAEVEIWKKAILGASGSTVAVEQLGKSLVQAYSEVSN